MSTTAIAQAYARATKTLNGRLLAPYQREGVMWLIWRELANSGPKGGFLCDEMGLGKTVQIISAILGNPGKITLIVVPKSIVTQWSEELENFAPNLKVHIHFTDFIKEDRTAVGLFEKTYLAGLGIGKSSPFMSKQFCFQQVKGERTTVDLNKGFRLSG